jgi:SagB-type dehydrogenase family enzyme
MSGVLESVIAYHQATKHRFHAYARGPGYLDWANQPDPFRRYDGASLIALEHPSGGESPAYDDALVSGNLRPEPLNRTSVSRLFRDSLALSAWKRAGEVSWALRVNPSSGNLHPTEGYIVCGAVEGLCDTPMVSHYAPKEHALERRLKFSEALWDELAGRFPEDTWILGLTSVHWREAWKYGERAYRYCQHDVGHAIAAISVAAAGLGWWVSLLDDVGTEEIGALLGVFDTADAETEHPDCLLAVHPRDRTLDTYDLPQGIADKFRSLPWEGTPNRLSSDHVEWPIIDEVAGAVIRPPGAYAPTARDRVVGPPPPAERLQPLREIIHQRRSAVAMDGRMEIGRNDFFRILDRTIPATDRVPFRAFPWSSRIHLVLFVHRVREMEPGLYILLRNPDDKENLRSAIRDEFVWKVPGECPANLDLYLLMPGDTRQVSKTLSCHQEIASDGCFSLGMLADFDHSLDRYGAWFYPRLYWECGMIGQVLYLEAEAAGLRGTGIGCFFDDAVHELLGIDSLQYQSLYHFTIGGPVEDTRISTLPAYPHP